MAELSKLGRYELRRVLGRGAMGLVYEGFDPTLSRRVAVKTILKNAALDEDTQRAYAARFIVEAKAVARLNHPHIVQVHDFGVEGDIAYLVMEFIQGRELRSFFEAREEFDASETVRIMGELLDALDFAHEAGVIHRDVKPANVMLDTQRRVKLADFGVARIQDSAQRSGADTMVGTPAFMSPEQIQGHKIDRRTDIFSAGVLLYQLLTGEHPFKGRGAWTVAKAIMQHDPPRPSSITVAVSPVFDDIVNKALAKEPAERFANAKEFAAALRGAIGDARPLPPAVPKQPVKVVRHTSDAELEFWRSIQNNNDPAELEVYLEEFPEGTYAQLARIKLAKLIAPIEAGRKEAKEKEEREAEEKARKEAEENATRQAAVAARREAEAMARQVQALARVKRQEEAATLTVGSSPGAVPDPPATRRKSLAMPAIAAAVVIAAGIAGYLLLGRTPAPAPVAGAPSAPAVDVEKIRRETEERLRKEFAEKAAIEKAAMEKAVAEKIAAEKAAAEKLAQAKTAAEKAAAERAIQKARADRAAADRAAADRAAQTTAAAEKAAAESVAAEKAAAERAIQQKAAAERAMADRAAAEKMAQTKAAADRAAAEKMAQTKAAADKAAVEKAAADKAAAEKANAVEPCFVNSCLGQLPPRGNYGR